MKVTQLLLLVALVAFAPAAVFAMQDQPPLETNAGTTFFQDAGSIGIVIIVLSVVALTMIIKEVMAIRRDQLAPPELIDEIEALFEAGEYQEAIELCETEACYFTNIVASGLPKLNASFEAMEAIKILVGTGETLAGHLLIADMKSMDWRKLKLPKNPACSACGH